MVLECNFFLLIPLHKKAITLVPLEQIEQLQCLSLFTPQGLRGIFRTLVTRVTCLETVIKFPNFIIPKLNFPPFQQVLPGMLLSQQFFKGLSILTVSLVRPSLNG